MPGGIALRPRQGDLPDPERTARRPGLPALDRTGAGHHLLPDLVAALHNNQVNIALDGHVEGVHGGIRNTFEAVPDAPATEFVLEMQGGSKGLLENSTNLFAKPNHASAVFTGHNGKVEKSTR